MNCWASVLSIHRRDNLKGNTENHGGFAENHREIRDLLNHLKQVIIGIKNDLIEGIRAFGTQIPEIEEFDSIKLLID
jgi:hypothetical protein